MKYYIKMIIDLFRSKPKRGTMWIPVPYSAGPEWSHWGY